MSSNNLEWDNECLWRPFKHKWLEHLWNELKWNIWWSIWRLNLVLRLEVQQSTHYLLADIRFGVHSSIRDIHSRAKSFNYFTHWLSLLLLLHRLNGLFSRATWVCRHQKGKTSLDLNEARDDEVCGMQRHQLDHMQTINTSLQTDNHTNTSSLNFYRPGARFTKYLTTILR